MADSRLDTLCEDLPDILQLRVLQYHIDRAAIACKAIKRQLDDDFISQKCVLADALTEQYPPDGEHYWHVGATRAILISRMSRDHTVWPKWELPVKAREMIVDFDRGKPVEPATFVLTRYSDPRHTVFP
jgi:hypothetical protein